MNAKTDSHAIPEALLQRLSDYLTARVCLHFAKRSWKELQQKMTAAMTDFGFNRVEEFIEGLLSLSPTQNQIEILASHLTVGETYFFRERRAFEILEQSLLPGLIAARRKTEKRLRFWSAGCSTGEEPYSLAILLDKLIPDLKDWNVTILVTDINTGAAKQHQRHGFHLLPQRPDVFCPGTEHTDGRTLPPVPSRRRLSDRQPRRDGAPAPFAVRDSPPPGLHFLQEDRP